MIGYGSSLHAVLVSLSALMILLYLLISNKHISLPINLSIFFYGWNLCLPDGMASLSDGTAHNAMVAVKLLGLVVPAAVVLVVLPVDLAAVAVQLVEAVIKVTQ